MGMTCCDKCWERPCVCGHEAKEKTKLRKEFYNSMTSAKDAELRDQIAGSCRVVQRHVEGIVTDACSIMRMPPYKTEAEDALNQSERVLLLALKAIRKAKEQMGKKELEKIAS